MRAPPDRLNELLDAYLAAEYRWHGGGHWHPLVVGRPAPELDAEFPGASRFGLISAWNPQSVPQPKHVNRDADQALHDALERSGQACRPAFAAAPNRSWKEAGWLVVDLPLSDFDALAHRFGQLSALCWQPSEPVRLRMYAHAPAIDGHAFVDWIK